MPELVAHRGYAAKYPENTLPALRAALRAGVIWVECDVQLAGDRVPVLLHDATLDRTANDPRSVFELDATELAEVSVHEPSRLGHMFQPTPVPGLDAAVELIARHEGATLFVEIKQESIDRYGLDVVAGQVGEACGEAPERCVLISFNDRVLKRARKRSGFSIGWVLGAWSPETRSIATAMAPDFLFVNAKRLPPDAALWPGPWRWVCYDAKTADDALRMAARGFGLIETKAVGELLMDPRIAAWQRA